MNPSDDGAKLIVVEGKDVILTRLQRHILYSLDEGKAISDKYLAEDVVRAVMNLVGLRMVGVTAEKWSLTWLGVLTVNACRLASGQPPVA